MDDREPQHQDHDLVSDAGDEIKGMAKDGLNHPSTKPVLTWPLGLVAGAGFMLYKRLRP